MSENNPMKTLRGLSDESLAKLLVKAVLEQIRFPGKFKYKVECFQQALRKEYASPKIHTLTKSCVEIYVKEKGLKLFKKEMERNEYEAWKDFLEFCSKNINLEQ